MKYAEILALRDLTILDILLGELQMPDDQKEHFIHFFEKAVQAADRDLSVQLRDLFGRDAERILKRKEETEASTL